MSESISVRPARADDLPAAARVYMLADADDPEADEAEALDDLRLLQKEDPNQLWVATADDAAVGFAAAVVRDRHWHLAYLFVRPDCQGKGIGRALLTACHDAGRSRGCTVFTTEPSTDPRALSRYLALGMFPTPPAIELRAVDPAFSVPNVEDGLESIPLAAGDDVLLATASDIDKAVAGASRRQDLRRRLAAGASGALLVDRARAVPAGYFVVSVDARGRGILSAAAMETERFGDILRRALVAAADVQTAGVEWRVLVPGENRVALDPLFAAGFRPRRLIPLLASGPIGRWDRYLFHDLDFL